MLSSYILTNLSHKCLIRRYNQFVFKHLLVCDSYCITVRISIHLKGSVSIIVFCMESLAAAAGMCQTGGITFVSLYLQHTFTFRSFASSSLFMHEYPVAAASRHTK